MEGTIRQVQLLPKENLEFEVGIVISLGRKQRCMYFILYDNQKFDLICGHFRNLLFSSSMKVKHANNLSNKYIECNSIYYIIKR